MCLSPIRLKDKTQVACRGCRICRDNRINDLVGRCIAEQQTSSGAFAVTLTYAGDGPETASLRYSDFQLFMKSLRNDGFKVRYIVAGEYGEQKARAHWHAVLFFKGKLPEVRIEKRVNWKYWPHGFSYFQDPDYGGFRYVLKYALKDQDGTGQSRALAMSKKPPLGYQFFTEIADDLVARRLPVNSPEYAFKSVKTKKGKFLRFWLQGRMREKFLDRYQTMWRMVNGGEPPWSDFFLEGYLDKIERARRDIDPKAFLDKVEAERPKRVYLVPDPDETESVLDNSSGILFLNGLGRDMFLVAYPNGKAVLVNGDKETWLTTEIGSDARLLLGAGLPLSSVPQLLAWLLPKWQASGAIKGPIRL